MTFGFVIRCFGALKTIRPNKEERGQSDGAHFTKEMA